MVSKATSSTRARWEEYRDQYEAHFAALCQDPNYWKSENNERIDMVVKPGGVDLESFCGTEGELAFAIEQLYATDGRDFKPLVKYPPKMLSLYGKEFAMHARGIYHREFFSEDSVLCSRKVWTPSLSRIGDVTLESLDRARRARTLAERARDNERWRKSEYAWEADAWSDVFRPMWDDPCLEVDKHDYTTFLADTDPITCHLTGSSTMASRTPDATFGLGTFSDRESMLPAWTSALHKDCLERLMLHPKYGLISDAKITDISLCFPFMVYEAKGWSGDCRAARRQACSASAVFLDMLDHLARRPGPVGSGRPYQTDTSHHYQVFVLTSFGAYWHLLVGHRRPRQPLEHAGEFGMSDTVYIFQRLWSGRVTKEQSANELLSLIDQIHTWAITEFRTFVINHLRPWHERCERNYLLQWVSHHSTVEQKKRKRASGDVGGLLVPHWVSNMQVSSRRLLQARAKACLQDAIETSRQLEGKSKRKDRFDIKWSCTIPDCGVTDLWTTAFLDHLRRYHDHDDHEIAQLRWNIQETRTQMEIKARLRRGEMATGYKWPKNLGLNPFQNQKVEIEDIFAVSPAKRRKIVASEKRISWSSMELAQQGQRK